MKELEIRGIVRDYWNKEGTHRPYRAVLYELDDKTPLDLNSEVSDFLRDADGREFEVIVRVKDEHRNAKGFRYQLTEAHKYSRVPVEKGICEYCEQSRCTCRTQLQENDGSVDRDWESPAAKGSGHE